MSGAAYGLIGERIGYSLSPRIHALIFERLGLDAEYVLMQTPREKVGALRETLLQMRGANVTIPYKKTLMPLCDEIAPEAQAIGAINTIANRDGRLIGYNTDYYGFLKTVEAVGFSAQTPPEVCAVLGTGGASLAVVRVLEDLGATKIYRVSRTPEPGQIDYAALQDVRGDLIVNATPVGTFPDVDKAPVGADVLGRFGAAIDLVYNPDPTAFVTCARSLGLRACSGLLMLAAQAVKSQEIWQRRPLGDALAAQICEALR